MMRARGKGCNGLIQ